MHELSIVMGIINIAEDQARREGALAIEEIELEIGCLTTVEMAAFEAAWKQAVKATLLEHAVKMIERTPGRAACLECGEQFALNNLYDACPQCNSHLLNITQGKALRVRSLVIREDKPLHS
ncbi:hydrogenase expression protein [Niastella koreensis]|uniref:Hydrogenase maturation factor HypA n=2 Tax=Niastella koreensis TaxID=354356 RepID=G8TLP5_NIAKG|nr:hydrogenase maturation nickel metallochaperone HypA [Niastella koreensis]AEV97637.1 hydrogenase expression/synthesis HypA [Niastella koreensis GR20-10]OQP40538.1 hydrogenase expression protein [Niastella koreensis]